MRSLLVITNADAGTSDQETLATALDVLRSEASVEVAKTSNPGELDGVLHRAGGRTVVVAGGDGSIHAVVTALHKRHELAGSTLALLPMGTGNDFTRVAYGVVRRARHPVDRVALALLSASCHADKAIGGDRARPERPRGGVGAVPRGGSDAPLGVRASSTIRRSHPRVRADLPSGRQHCAIKALLTVARSGRWH